MFGFFADEIAEDASVALVAAVTLSLGAVALNALGHVVRFFA